MAYGFEFLEQGTGKVLYSSKTLYYQIIDSFQVSSIDGNGSKTYPSSVGVKAMVFKSTGGCICKVSVVGNTVNWQWVSFGSGAVCNDNVSKAIIYVYSH